MDFESKPNDGYEDGELYSNLTRKAGNGLMKQSLVRYIVMASIVLVLVFLLILIFHRSENKDQKSLPSEAVGNVDLTQLNNHIQQLDKRLALAEKRIADLSTISGKLSAVEESSASNAKGVEALSAKLEKIESRIGKVATREKTTIEKQPQAKPKAGSSEVKRETRKAAVGTEYHVVRKGETLYHIAKAYGITLQRLQSLNHLKNGQPIRPGEKLVIRKSE